MPITGLPVILENSLSQLLKECDLSKFKIISNKNGSSTVVLHFDSISSLASDRPPSPPRLKSPSQLRRDRQRKSNFVCRKQNKPDRRSSLCNTPQFVDVSSSSSSQPCETTVEVPLQPMLCDSGVQCVDTSLREEHNAQHITNTLPITERLNLASCDAHTTKTETEGENVRHHDDNNEKCSPNSDISSPNASPSHPENPKDAEVYKESDSGESLYLFRSDKDHYAAIDTLKSLGEFRRGRLKVPNRNGKVYRVARPTNDDAEENNTLLVETHDLFFQFFPRTKSVGFFHLSPGSKTPTPATVPYRNFRALPPYYIDKSSEEYQRLMDVLEELNDFVLDNL